MSRRTLPSTTGYRTLNCSISSTASVLEWGRPWESNRSSKYPFSARQSPVTLTGANRPGSNTGTRNLLVSLRGVSLSGWTPPGCRPLAERLGPMAVSGVVNAILLVRRLLSVRSYMGTNIARQAPRRTRLQSFARMPLAVQNGVTEASCRANCAPSRQLPSFPKAREPWFTLMTSARRP